MGTTEAILTTSTQKTNNSKLTTQERAIHRINAASVVALDLETTGLDPRQAEIRLAQVSDGEKIFILDLFHRDARPLFEALAREDLVVLAHSGDFEWRFVYHHFGIALDNIVDTLLLSRLAFCGDMSERVGLGYMVESELEIELDKDMQQADWTLDPLPRRQLDYAAMDVKVLHPLYELLSSVISDTEQDHVAEIELEAMPAFARMKHLGMPVDKAAWDKRAEKAERVLKRLEQHMLDAEWLPKRAPIKQAWALQGADCLAMLHKAGYSALEGTTAKDLAAYSDNELVRALLTYRKAKGDERDNLRARVLEHAPEKPPKPAPPWNFGSPGQVAVIAYEILGFEPSDTGVGALLMYRDRHPFFEYMLKHRKLKKLVSTYGKTWFQKAYSSEAGRVYPAWRQIGTSTGRVSSGERYVAPNAQNLPKSYRKYFVAPEGRTFVDADYSQIEVRVLAKLLNEERLLEIYGRPEDETKSGDVYRATAAHMLGVDVEAFYDLYPKIRDYHDDTLETLDEMGSVDQRTLTGRLRGEITNRNEAINAPIQGTSADVLKRAMALAYGRLKAFDDAFVVASIHDELLVECNEGDAEAVAGVVEASMLEAADEILNADEPRVKIEVDVAVNKRWVQG